MGHARVTVIPFWRAALSLPRESVSWGAPGFFFFLLGGGGRGKLLYVIQAARLGHSRRLSACQARCSSQIPCLSPAVTGVDCMDPLLRLSHSRTSRHP